MLMLMLIAVTAATAIAAYSRSPEAEIAFEPNTMLWCSDAAGMNTVAQAHLM